MPTITPIRSVSALLVISAVSLVFSVSPAADASETRAAQPDEAEHVVIQASTDFLEMHPGDTGLLAIEVEVEEGWHTYWPGVSDTGYGMSFTIDHPGWIELEDPIWPTPERHLQKGDILDHIYEGTQTVLYPFRVSSEAQPGQTAVFNADSSFLVCDEICLPGTASSTTAIQIVAQDQRTSQSSGFDSLHALFEKRPQRFSPNDPAVRMQWIKSAAAVMFRDAKRVEFYPDLDCSELEDPIGDASAEGNRLEITFVESDDKLLSGRIRIWTREGSEDFDIHESHQ